MSQNELQNPIIHVEKTQSKPSKMTACEDLHTMFKTSAKPVRFDVEEKRFVSCQ